MTRICHLLDGAFDWEHRLAIGQLLDRADGREHEFLLASVDARVPDDSEFPGWAIARLLIRGGLPIVSGPALRRWLADERVDAVCAWGPSAALAACSAASGRSLVVVRVVDPGASHVYAKILRAAPDELRIAVSCATQTVRRRVVEAGVGPDRCVVIRPGVDFAVINSARNDVEGVRRRAGFSSVDRLLLAALPVRRHSGHERVIWSAHLTHHLDSRYRLVVCGRGREVDRLRRLVEALPYAGGVCWSNGRCRYEELLATCDALIITPPDDVPTTPVAWAMAAGVPVIGSAVPAVAELIAHKHTGLLIKPDRGPRSAVAITRRVWELDGLAKERETARGQAYCLFGVRRFVDQTLQLMENLRDGAAADHGITDPAVR